MKFEKILCPIGFSASSAAAAAELAAAASLGGAVTLVQILELPGYARAAAATGTGAQLAGLAEKPPDEWIDLLVAAGGVPVDVDGLRGHPWEQIVKLAADYDVIVMTTHARRGLGAMLFGSVTEQVIKNAPCPVLVVPYRA
jgi:nucleotide-binding universal stress UspA family protein